MLDYENNPIIAAVKTREDLQVALNSETEAIFLLSSNRIDIDAITRLVHEHQKKLFIHTDFVDGLSKDAAGVKYLSTKGIDGIISTRSNIIAAAHEAGICSVQRFFMIDSRSVDTALDTLKQSKADMIEIMPALAYKSITKIKKNIHIPIIAGGLIDSRDEVYKAIGAGASMISTGCQDLWND